MVDKVNNLDNASSKETMSVFIDRFRIFASNNRNNDHILDVIDRAIQRCNPLNDQKSLVKLYEVKISQIEHLKERQQDIAQLVQQMKEISKKIKYTEGLALAYYKEWYIEKFRGNKERSRKALNNSMKYISENLDIEQYTFYVCNYSYAVEKWLTEHDIQSSVILEKCANYFYKNGYYRSFVQTIAILETIFTKMQKGNQIQEKCKLILENRLLFDKLPNDVKAIVYYFAGVGQSLQCNIKNAEVFFTESMRMFETTKDSIYYNYYYIRNIAHIATIQALVGKWDLALKNLNKMEDLLQKNKISKNFDEHSTKQVPHTLNLIKYYIYSRFNDFETSAHEELINSIYLRLEKQYSNPILLIEYIINADLKEERLEKLSNSNFANIKRVKHIVDYQIAKTKLNSSDKLSESSRSCFEILENRTKDEIKTYFEKAFTDLLIAKELFYLGDLEKIHLLLRKYDKRMDKLEVLEFRIFMEAFIQVGAYKSGDPLGPALQYMAIKKCRQYGFSRLESKLLKYLDIQGSDTLRLMT